MNVLLSGFSLSTPSKGDIAEKKDGFFTGGKGDASMDSPC